MPKQIGAIKLYEVEDLVKALAMSRETVRSYLKAGRLRGQKFGKRWFVSEESLHEFFNPTKDQVFTRAFLEAPEDDEPFTAAERAHEEEGWKECQEGKGRAWEEVREELAGE